MVIDRVYGETKPGPAPPSLRPGTVITSSPCPRFEPVEPVELPVPVELLVELLVLVELVVPVELLVPVELVEVEEPVLAAPVVPELELELPDVTEPELGPVLDPLEACDVVPEEPDPAAPLVEEVGLVPGSHPTRSETASVAHATVPNGRSMNPPDTR
ncbi:MAG: hypothetical protein JST54_25370 [Deltaproteobacteria bacterium]|nr:hypothetical protein [Deltaproteobacteria bacterium]